MGGMGNIGPLLPPMGGTQNVQGSSGQGKEKKGLAATREGQLSPEEQQEVQQLRQRDTEVRQHEQAHLAAAGGYARGGANYTYTTGPDGKRYATGGEVSIDTGPASKPEETIRKMEVVKRAAMAPANPSSQDRAVYAAAVRTETQAQQKAAENKREDVQKKNETEQVSPASGQRSTSNVAQPPLSPTEGLGSAPRQPSTGLVVPIPPLFDVRA